MMKIFFLSTLTSFVLIMAASFTELGAFMALILAVPFHIGGLDGLQFLWLIAILGGVPFFGYVFALIFPGEDGRLEGVISVTGFWVGLFSGAVMATALRGTL